MIVGKALHEGGCLLDESVAIAKLGIHESRHQDIFITDAKCRIYTATPALVSLCPTASAFIYVRVISRVCFLALS